MENMSAFELARRLKELNPETSVLFTTAYEVTESEIGKELTSLGNSCSVAPTSIIKKESALIIQAYKTRKNTSISKRSFV